MNSSELNRLSGTQLTSSPLNTDFPEEFQSFSSISASSANAAPILFTTTKVRLADVREDSQAPNRTVGTPISSIINSTNVRDSGQLGIAITEVGTASNGIWYFTTDNGQQWAPLGDVSENSARLLFANLTSRIYFQPSANYNGVINNAITFRAWDRTDGTANGGTASVVSNGEATAFSVNTDTASLNVVAVNDAPINLVPTSTLTSRIDFNEDTEFLFKDNNAIQVSDIDVGDGSLDVTLSATRGTLFFSDSINPNPTQTLAISGNITTINTFLDKLVYKPTKNYNGPVNIRITTVDRGNTGIGGFARDEDLIYLNVLPVNDAPTFTKGSNQVINEDSSLQRTTWATNISKGAANEFAQTVKFVTTVSDEDKKLFEDGKTPTIDATGVLTYQLKPNVFGKIDVSVFIEDSEGAKSDPETFSIIVNSINDAPVNSIPLLTQEVREEAVLTFSNNNNNTISISDIDAGAGIMQVRVVASNGVLKATSTVGLDIRNNNTDLVILTGTIEQINAGLEGLEFKANKDFNGRASIDIITNDQGNSGRGPGYTVTNRIEIDVIPVNDPPRFTKGNNQIVKEDTPSQSLLWATDISSGAIGETNQFLRFKVTNDNNSLFSVQPQISPNGILSYTLAPNQNGIANVTVVLEDGDDNSDGGISVSDKETFTITVTPVNDGPSNRVPNTQLILEDSELRFTSDNNNAISISDIDAGDNPVQVQLITNNGILTWSDSKTILSTAQGKGTGIVIFTGKITDINTDLDGLTFKPSTNFNGFASIQVITNDQGSTGDGQAWQTSSNIGVIVNPVNDVPSFTGGSNIDVFEDAGLKQIAGWATRVTAGAADESQGLQFLVRNTNNALFAEQPRIVINGSLGTLVFRTAPNANGTAKVFVSLRDTGGTRDNGTDISAEQEFTINVGAVNDAPINSVPTPQTMDEEGTLVFSTRGSISNAVTVSDIDFEGLTLETTISTENGTLNVSNTSGLISSDITSGSITLVGTASAINRALDGLSFTPTANFHGTARIQVKTNDQGNIGGGALTDTDIITINVNPVNDAPTFTKGADIEVFEDAERYNEVWATEITTGPLDDTEQKLTFIVSNSNNALFSEQPSISSDGRLTFKSAADANGEATVTVKLQDDGGLLKNGRDISDAVTFKIKVNAVSDAPVNNIPTKIPTINEDGLALAIFSVNTGNAITITDVDKEINPTIQVTLSSEHGTIKLGNPAVVNGSSEYLSNVSFSGALSDINRALDGLEFKPNLDFNGEAKITIVSSKGDKQDIDIIKVNVTPVNDAPTVTPGVDLSVSAGASFSFEKWATFSPGPDNESAQQALQYTVISDTRLFSSGPFIDRQGNLTFTTARDIKTSTTATITVRVRDNGGTSLGGKDTSEEKTFKITVNPIQVNITTATEFIEEGNSGTTDYDFDVRLSGASNETVTVKYTTVDDSAKGADKDYEEISETLTFKPGETSKTVKIKVKGDTKFETDQSFRVNLLETKNVDFGRTLTAVGTIKNDDTRPVISIGDTYSREGSSIIKITVGLSNASDEEVTVNYIVTDGTATTASGDYVAGATIPVVFAPGETSKTIDITINDDDTLETNETFFVELKDPVNGTISTIFNKATAKIINDEAKNATDLNGDGYSDIVLRNYETGENAIWFVNNFTIDKGVIIDQQDTNWVLAGVADFTNEGKVDLLYHNRKTGKNEIWMMDGAKRLQILPLLQLTDTNWEITGIQDFNGDRKNDIMWYNSKTSESMIWQMNGPVISRSISLPKVVSKDLDVKLVADLSGDGKADIVWHNRNTGASTVWVMGNTTVEKEITLETSSDTNIEITGVGDFNNDAKLDIVVSNYTTGENKVWYLDNAANEIKITAKELLPNSGVDMRIEQITDFDNDGNFDLLYRNYSTGENEIWRLKGTKRDQIIKLTKLDEDFWEISV